MHFVYNSSYLADKRISTDGQHNDGIMRLGGGAVSLGGGQGDACSQPVSPQMTLTFIMVKRR